MTGFCSTRDDRGAGRIELVARAEFATILNDSANEQRSLSFARGSYTGSQQFDNLSKKW